MSDSIASLSHIYQVSGKGYAKLLKQQLLKWS